MAFISRVEVLVFSPCKGHTKVLLAQESRLPESGYISFCRLIYCEIAHSKFRSVYPYCTHLSYEYEVEDTKGADRNRSNDLVLNMQEIFAADWLFNKSSLEKTKS